MVQEWLAPSGAYTAVDLGVGLSTGHSDNFGGGTSGVALFDATGARIGMQREDGSTGEGDTAHLKVYSIDKNNNISPEYITVSQSGHNWDAICYSYVSVTAQSGDNTKFAMAVGEYAYQCNQAAGTDWPWYFSQRGVQISNNGKTELVRPKCLMLDTPDDKGVRNSKYAGFSAHLIDFNLDASVWKQWQNDSHQMCGSDARFRMYETLNERQCPQVFKNPPAPGAKIPMEEIPGCHPDDKHPEPHTDHAISDQDEYNLYVAEGSRDPVWSPPPVLHSHYKRVNAKERRGVHKRLFSERFVSSVHPDHTATELCGDPASAGPDFYSEYEHLFCDTTNHKLYQICSDQIKTDCFDLEAKKIRPDGHLVTRAEWPEYSDIQHWK